MKGRTLPTLHLEWAPGSVLALDRTDNRRARGAEIPELGRFIKGHREALVGVSRSCVFLKTLRLPKATPEELRRLLNLRLGQLFPIPASELAFDAIQTEDQNMEGWLTLVAAMRAQDLVQLRGELAQAGLKATRIFPIALAAPSVAAQSDALVIDKLPTGVNLDVVEGGLVRFSRTVSDDAPLEREIQRTLLAAGVTERETVQAHTLEALHRAPSFSFSLNEDRATAEKKRLADKNRLAILLLVSSLLLSGLLWIDRMEAQSKVDAANLKWEGKLKTLRVTRDAELAKASRAAVVQKSLERAFSPAQPLSDIVKAASNSLPQGVWLVGINTERGKPLQLRGTALSGQKVAQVVDNLSLGERFRDVKLVFANQGKIEDTPVVQFNVAATAVGNLPMPAPEKSGKKATRRTTSKLASSTTGGTP